MAILGKPPLRASSVVACACVFAVVSAFVCVVLFFCVPVSVVCVDLCVYTLGVLLNLLMCNYLFLLMKNMLCTT